MTRFCEYKDILGKPREGAHSMRLKIGNYDFALIDIILTIMLAAIISAYLKIGIINSLIYTFLLGIIMHWLFCVDTQLNLLIYDIFGINKE